MRHIQSETLGTPTTSKRHESNILGHTFPKIKNLLLSMQLRSFYLPSRGFFYVFKS